MAKKKKTVRPRTSSTKLRARRTSSRVKREAVVGSIGRFGVPLLISGILIACIAVFGTAFYRNVTGSDFFDVRAIYIRGNDHTSEEDIRRVAAAGVAKSGVWNADLGELRAKIEKFPFVKAAAVSRALPVGLRIDVTERVPAGIVRFSSGNYLVDVEGTVLASANVADKNFPFVMQGWDESKTEKAGTDNLARLKVYKKMLDEWKQFQLAARVKDVNLANPRDPIATIEDSGRLISVTLARDNLGVSLKTAIEAVSGKGAKVRSVNSEGVSPVINFLEIGNE